MFQALLDVAICDKGNIHYLRWIVYTVIDFVLLAKVTFKHRHIDRLSTEIFAVVRAPYAGRT